MILYTHDLWPDETQYRPALGEVMRSGLTYREHQQSAHLWAYHFGDTSVIHVGEVFGDPSWTNITPGKEPVSSYQTTLATECTYEGGPGRPDLGAYRTITFLDTTQTYEVRLRGSNIEVRLMIGVDGEKPVELVLGTYENGANTYPSRRFVRLPTGDTANVLAWVTQVRAPGKVGYLEQIEITPCRFGGDAPVDSTTSSISTVATMPSGMDYPTLGGDVVIGARDPAVGDMTPAPLLSGGRLKPWPASDLTHDVEGYTSGAQWETSDQGFIFVRLEGPSMHVAAAAPKSTVMTPTSDGLFSDTAWVFSLSMAPFNIHPDNSGAIWSTDVISLELIDASGPTRDVELSGIGKVGTWEPTTWFDVTVAWVPNDANTSVADVFCWFDGKLVASFSAGANPPGVLRLGSAYLADDLVAWPVLMRCQRNELGTLSEILGYVESWLGWRGMMTGIF
ncbi:hypothetical protein EA187_17900 [Lujinxingia sediminis]|uniref:Uncharacterized protein n=1 Tax=Lujinxingia sediminis TaxID=2480984 RepID=A0ABY0CNJ2_9DELT|nr:hypothetical protein [Lujinxingia sediminis]RVU41533.1 hypothetical protein EA187_17900 [Lujinxingia sediminis]